jgi:NIMA (never in mitosis gene a)-related kinase
VEYFDSFVENTNFYIEMEYCGGGDVAKKIAERKEASGRFKNREIQQILFEAALGIKFVHDEHVMHRDIKGGNLLLDSKGHVKIGDFGISKILEGTVKGSTTGIGTLFDFVDNLSKLIHRFYLTVLLF